MIHKAGENDKVFSALSDSTRRKIIELLHQGDASILELSGSFTMSFQALSKHIKILENAGILTKKKHGKFVICSLKQNALKKSLEWISYYSNFWNDSFNKLDDLLQQQKDD